MANLTLAIDDDLLKRARMRALAEDTTVNALVRDFLADYADEEAKAAIARFLERADERREPGREERPRTWTRDQLYEDQIG